LVAGAVATVLAGVSTFIADPTGYIWNVILLGVRQRAGALFDAITSEEPPQ
jgi:hypothetical protein